jgi:hypothetical protein
VIAYKFLAAGAVSPFTGFRWPGGGEWVAAAAARDEAWIHACRRGDLPYWLDDELWLLELDGPVRESRYQIAAPRARLVSRIAGWTPALRGEYASACALRAREVALPHLAPELRRAIGGVDGLQALAEALRPAASASAVAGYASDAADTALAGETATASYIACALAASVGGGLAAFEAERAWQARWLAERLAIPSA